MEQNDFNALYKKVIDGLPTDKEIANCTPEQLKLIRERYDTVSQRISFLIKGDLKHKHSHHYRSNPNE